MTTLKMVLGVYPEKGRADPQPTRAVSKLSDRNSNSIPTPQGTRTPEVQWESQGNPQERENELKYPSPTLEAEVFSSGLVSALEV